MNISGIRPYSGFYDYNSIQNVGSAASVNNTQKAEEQSQPQQKTAGTAVAAQRDTSAQTFNAADYAMQYQPEASYDLKGVESDIRSLDVEQAISDLQKDQVLQQYQFFVGESIGQNNIGAMSENAGAQSVRATENFSF